MREWSGTPAGQDASGDMLLAFHAVGAGWDAGGDLLLAQSGKIQRLTFADSASLRFRKLAGASTHSDLIRALHPPGHPDW